MTSASAVGDADASDRGLTLLEMLIVLAVIAIASGATILSLTPRRGNATEIEARLLATIIQSAVDRSIATGERDVLTVDETGYAVGGAPRHALPDATVLGGPPAARLSLALDGGRPFDLVLSHGSDRWTVSFDGLRAVAAAAKDAV